MDLNVAAAWAQGVTGKNVTTAIMDDGVDYMHPDIIHNYVSRVIFSTFTQPHKKEKPYFAIKCFNDLHLAENVESLVKIASFITERTC